jgi:hypothetical protein
MQRLIKPDDPPELRKYLRSQLFRDMEVLRKGAQHLRVLAWFLFIPTSFLSFVLFLYMLMKPAAGNVALFILMLMLLGIAGFFFSLSTYIRRARQWAVNIALGLALFPIVVTVLLATQPEFGLIKRSPLNLSIELMYLVFHIKAVLELSKCLGAVHRIAAAAQLRYGTVPVESGVLWDQPDRA